MKPNNPGARPSHQEQLKQLYMNQKQTLDLFLKNGAISRAQYDKSLRDLTRKMDMDREPLPEASPSPPEKQPTLTRLSRQGGPEP